MDITKRLSIQYAKKLLPHYHLEKYPAIFKNSEKKGFEKELLFILDENKSDYNNNYNSHAIRFLFGDKLSICKDLNTGLEIDITADVNHYLISIKCLDKEKEFRKNHSLN